MFSKSFVIFSLFAGMGLVANGDCLAGTSITLLNGAQPAAYNLNLSQNANQSNRLLVLDQDINSLKMQGSGAVALTRNKENRAIPLNRNQSSSGKDGYLLKCLFRVSERDLANFPSPVWAGNRKTGAPLRQGHSAAIGALIPALNNNRMMLRSRNRSNSDGIAYLLNGPYQAPNGEVANLPNTPRAANGSITPLDPSLSIATSSSNLVFNGLAAENHGAKSNGGSPVYLATGLRSDYPGPELSKNAKESQRTSGLTLKKGWANGPVNIAEPKVGLSG
jgi:hypothetical protein